MKSLTFILRFAIITVMILSSSCQKQTDYSADINALKATSNALRASRDSLAAALRITNANLLATNNALASLSSSVTAIQTQLGVISGQITTLNTQLTATNAIVAGHTTTIATIQAQIKTIQDQITSLNSQQTSTSSLVSGLSNTVSSIQAQITTILASIDTLNSQQSTTSAGLADISAKLLLSNNQLTSLALAFNSLLTNLTIAPIITTTDPSAITSSTFTSGGNISNDGGSPVTARGVCWSTNQNPTIANSKTSDGTGKGTFTSAITGLASATTYYVRAYATNSVGTSYGSQVTAITTVIGELSAYLFMESTDDAICSGNQNTDICTYMLTHAKSWYGFWTSGVAGINADDLAIYMDWPGFVNGTSNVPKAIKITIPQTSGGLDSYGNPIEAYKFLTTRIQSNTSKGNIWYSVIVPPALTNNQFYSSIGFNYSDGPNSLTYASTEPLVYAQNISYIGSNWEKSSYKIYTQSGAYNGFNVGSQGVLNTFNHYFRGGPLTK